MYSIQMYIYMANEKDPGPCSAPKCGKFDPSNRYVHFCRKALDQPEFTDYVYRQYKITDTDCICRKCESTFKRSFENCSHKQCTELFHC
jgi:hypothetical protein